MIWNFLWTIKRDYGRMGGEVSMYIAHCKQNEDGEWAPDHCLLEHSEGVARLAAQSAKDFGNDDWAIQIVKFIFGVKSGM